MPKGDAFSGIKLSEQVGQVSVEQRLFSTSPRPSSAPNAAEPGNQETGKPGNREVGKEGKKETSQETRQEVGKQGNHDFDIFDIEETPTHKDSFLFTEAEFEALEDLKLEFRRRYDTKITKNDIARSALHLLVQDYRENKERSFLGKRFLRKPAKR